MKIPIGNREAVYMYPMVNAACQVHAWPTEGMARRLVLAMRETYGKGGINVCRECVTRARQPS